MSLGIYDMSISLLRKAVALATILLSLLTIVYVLADVPSLIVVVSLFFIVLINAGLCWSIASKNNE